MKGINYIIVATLIHGGIFIFLILKKSENRIANRLFICMILSIMHTAFTYMIIENEWYVSYPLLNLLPFGASFVTAPAFYLFIRYLVQARASFTKKDLFHFSPLLINYLHSFYHLYYGPGIAHKELHNFTEAIQMLAIIPGIIYLYLTYLLINQYTQELKDHFSNLYQRTIRFAKGQLYIFISIYALAIIYVLVDFKLLYDFKQEFSGSILMPYDELLVLFYCVGLYWTTLGTFLLKQVPRPSSPHSKQEKNFTSLKHDIIACMESEKLYLNPDLSLRFLEEKLNVPAKDISTVLNQLLEKNFYDFTNEYRLEEAKHKLSNKDLSYLTIEAIAFDSGFNSKATFHRIFKEKMGQSPHQYRKSQ